MRCGNRTSRKARPAAALDDLASAAAGHYSPGKSWPQHERRLSEAAEQARAAARNARESLRWNPRARVERAVPQPDGVVLDSLEELTARTRAVARVLMDAAAGDEPLDLPASFGESYAAMLRMLTGPVRQLADLRSAPPDRDELAHQFLVRSCVVGWEPWPTSTPARRPSPGSTTIC